MSDYEFARQFQDAFEKMMAKLNDNDYLVDEKQQAKLLAVVAVFAKQIKEIGGKFDGYELIPRLEHGYVTATFPVVDLTGKSVRDFCAALSEASAITLDATDDGVCISVTIPNVFHPKR